MRPTEMLMAEHRIIGLVLRCLDRIADDGDEHGRFDAEAAGMALEFFEQFMGSCHHRKEEDYLFLLLEERGFCRESGPTGVMLHEHEVGARHLQTMRTALDAAGSGKHEIWRFASAARAYTELLREHIEKEDRCLFTMVDHALGTRDQAVLEEAFRRADTVDARLRRRLLGIARTLASRLDVPGSVD